MKNTLTLLGLIVATGYFSQAQIEALELVHNFDTIYQNQQVQNDFKFVNTGNEPLIITKANTSCGCDVATWPKEPIMPGDTLIVKYKYDSKRLGPINKSMTVSSNAANNPTLVVRNKGIILPNKE